MEKRNIVKNQKGFTLIEIIAVLVILGILAAVAVPKYFDLQDQANEKAALAIFGTCNSVASMNFAQGALDPDNDDYVAITDMTQIANLMDPVGAPEGWEDGVTWKKSEYIIGVTTPEEKGVSRAVLYFTKPTKPTTP